MQHRLVVKQVGKNYNGRSVVRDVSFEVSSGSVVGLLGPNGAGKTTTFYMVMGLIAPDHGNIELDGIDVTKLPVYRRARLGIGYLPQESSVFRGLNVEQNINAVLEIHEPDISKREERLDSLLAEFSIEYLRHSSVLSLSGGERRRLEIARSLAMNPRFILFDEPLAGIDPIAVDEIANIISHLKSKGIGVLITDHNVREALSMIDYAYIIYDGKILSSGKPADIIKDKAVKKVYLGEKFNF
jgi:lipopolysaccharide export system ATP-binding protein